MSGYYRPRWEIFIYEVSKALEQGKEFNQEAFNQKMIKLEQMFVDIDYVTTNRPRIEGVKIAKELMMKYRDDICTD